MSFRSNAEEEKWVLQLKHLKESKFFGMLDMHISVPLVAGARQIESLFIGQAHDYLEGLEEFKHMERVPPHRGI